MRSRAFIPWIIATTATRNATDYEDPEQREERAELMAPWGLQVLEDGVPELHPGEA